MNIFIDGGTNIFQGLSSFNQNLQFDENWKIYCFEANPETYARATKRVPAWLQNLDFKLFNQAISDSNGFVNVNCASSDDSCMHYYEGSLWKNHALRIIGKIRRTLKISPYRNQGSNILENPPANDGDHIFRYKTIQVPSVRLSDFVQNIIETEKPEKIIVKLDIEGAEFSVLDDLFSTPAVTEINELYVEFHERFFKGQEADYEQ
ncbi:MAG: FkbM family methyltransferase, partial [Microcystaceae cyanobacterium]